MKRMGILPLVCAAALVVGCNTNKTADNRDEPAAVGTAGEADRTAVHDSEKDFVGNQLADGEAEIELGRMAAQKASNPEVKRFAQMMVDDHTKAGDQLKQIASTSAIPQDAKVDDKHKDLMDKLSKLRGMDFDKEYMSAMIDDHEDAVRDLRSRVDENRSLGDRVTGKNPENPAAVKPESSDNRVTASVNQWAADALPTVERHLDRAKQVKDNLDHNTRGTSGTNRGTTKY